MHKRVVIIGWVIALVGASWACSDPAPPTWTVPDVGEIDEDVGDNQHQDLDAEGDADSQDVEGDTGDPPVQTRTCPESIQNSCLAPALNCVGDATSMVQCLSFGEPGSPGYRQQAQFSNGAVVDYRILNQDGEIREFRTAYGSDGDRCYNMAALEEGDEPSSWRVSDPQFGSFELHFAGSDIDVVCPVGDEERCSRLRFDNAFSLFFDRPQGCEPFQPDDRCEINADCGSGLACCRTDPQSVRQCLPLDFCISQQDPIECSTSGDCNSGETCLRCTRSGVRECIPDEIAQDESNTLGCVEDDCVPGDGTCSGDNICCEVANVFQCIFPSECSSAPDPNPTCNPDSSQPCALGSHQCCFVHQINEFRCLSDVTFCQTNVCFSDSDCGSNEECCGADSASMTSGSCFDTCDPPDLSCDSQDDCFGEHYCCMPPGYSTGECVSNEMNCEFIPCNTTPECGDPEMICCDEAPLTEGICLVEGLQQCPPPQ